MESPHTPGPFYSEVPPSSCEAIRFIVSHGGQRVASVEQSRDMPQGEALANADLLTAAPLMLAALHRAAEIMSEIIAMHGSDSAAECRAEVRAAIAAALGDPYALRSIRIRADEEPDQ